MSGIESQKATIASRGWRAESRGREQVCSEIGFSVNAALNIFVKRVVRDRKIPFELTADPFYCESNLRHLRKSADDARNGRVTEHELIDP